MKKTIWANKNFLEYDAFVQSSTSVDSSDWQQQYEIYNHAESIIGKNPSGHDLACAVFQLNRAIDFREKLLNQHYKFKKIPGFQNKKQHEAMHELGIIKPLLKTKLDKIRNNVMHSAKYPISKLSEVAELAEFIWYFLRSTDLIASRKATDLLFNYSASDDKEEWAEITFDTEKWKIEIRGMLFNNNILNNSETNSIEIKVYTIKQKTESKYFSGVVLGPEKILHEIVIKYFSAL